MMKLEEIINKLVTALSSFVNILVTLVGTIKFDTHVDVILGEALPQVVDVGVPDPLGVPAALVKLTPHLAQVVGSHLLRGMK